MQTLSFLLLIAFGSVISSPVVDPVRDEHDLERKTKLVSDARMQYTRHTAKTSPSQSTNSNVDGKGKAKLIDSSDGLDKYLSKETIRSSSTPLANRMSVAATLQKAAFLAASTSGSDATVLKAQSMRAGSSIKRRAPRKDTRKQITATTEESLLSDTTNRRRGPKGQMQWDRRQTFRQVWIDTGCSTQLSPILLAEKVMSMRAHGVDPTSSASLAGKIVKAKADPDYETKYFARMRKLLNYYSREMLSMKKDDYFKDLPPAKQASLVLEQTFKNMAKFDTIRKKAEASLGTGPLASHTEFAKIVETVGNLMRTRIEEKGMKLDELSSEQLEKEIRGTEIPHGIARAQFTRSVYRYLQHTRKIKYYDLENMKRKRRAEQMKGYREKKKGRLS